MESTQTQLKTLTCTSVGWNTKLSSRKSPWTSVTSSSSPGKFVINQSESSFMAGMSLCAAATYCFVQVETFREEKSDPVFTLITHNRFFFLIQISPVSCSTPGLSQILQGPTTSGPVNAALPRLPLQLHIRHFSLLESPQGGADLWICDPGHQKQVNNSRFR